MEYYIDFLKGKDSNPGTETNPFLSTEKVAKVIKPGDNINIKLPYIIFMELMVPKR